MAEAFRAASALVGSPMLAVAAVLAFPGVGLSWLSARFADDCDSGTDRGGDRTLSQSCVMAEAYVAGGLGVMACACASLRAAASVRTIFAGEVDMVWGCTWLFGFLGWALATTACTIVLAVGVFGQPGVALPPSFPALLRAF